MLIVSLAMQISGILVPYVRENIIWSYITYSPNPISFNKASAIKLAGLIWIPICAFLFARMTKSFASTNYSRKHRFRLLIIVLPITAISIVVFFNLINFGHDSFSNPFYILKYLMRVLVFSGIFSLVGLFFVAVTKKIRNTKLGNLSDAQLIQLSVALTAVIQLYPQWDEMHIWWLSPIFAVIVFNFLTFKEAHVAGFLVLLIFVASFQFLGNLSAERTKFSDELLTGMIGTKASVRDLGTTLVTLENHFTTREYKFDCDNAIYAGAGGKYLSEFHSYVNWGPVVRADNVQKPRGVFYCNLSYSQAIEKQMHSEYNYIKLIKSGSNSWNVLMMNQD